MPKFKTPNDQQHILVLGKNGTGKSVAAVWHLSLRDFETERWIIINHKRDELVNSIPHAKFLKMTERPGKNPGVYIYQPVPAIDDVAVTDLMYWVYEKENIGVYIDEGYMIDPRDPALTALLTQGRSKHIPMIILSQRPTRISRFAVSEATFFQVFYLTDRRDRKVINEFIPTVSLDELMDATQNDDGSWNPRALPDFHSIYYDTRGHDVLVMTPVPTDHDILIVFEEKLRPRGLLEFGKRRFL